MPSAKKLSLYGNNTRNLFRCAVVISGKSKKDHQAAIDKKDTREITQMEINQTKTGLTFVPSLGSEATPLQTPPIPPPPRTSPEFRGQIVQIIFHKYHGVVADRELEIRRDGRLLVTNFILDGCCLLLGVYKIMGE